VAPTVGNPKSASAMAAAVREDPYSASGTEPFKTMSIRAKAVRIVQNTHID
jgi:hypothetical protein